MCGFYLIVARLGDATSAFRPACLVQGHAFALHDDGGTCRPLLMSLWLGSVLSARVDYLRLSVSSGRNAPPHCDGWRKRWDSNPRYALTHGGFQDRCLKPLGHPSFNGPVSAQRRHGVKRTPSWPARSWMNCQATRPERPPRVTDHSTAAARNASWVMGRLNAAA